MAEAPQVGARILKELRRGRSWSWQEQARLLKRLAEQHGVERIAAATTASISRTIARWESGRYAYKPDERYQLLLAYAYATRDSEPAVAPGSDLDRLMVALGEMGVSLDRRQVLRTLATATAHLRQGDPEATCHVLGDCVELVARTRGRVAGQRLHRLRRDLQPWRTERFVEELDDRMLDAFA